MGFENSETEKEYRWRSSCTPARRRECYQPLWFAAGKLPRPAGKFPRLPSQCWASAGALCLCTQRAGRRFPCSARSLRTQPTSKPDIHQNQIPKNKRRMPSGEHSAWEKRRRLPERIRPRLYEPLRRDPHRATTLIVGFAATTAAMSQSSVSFLYLRMFLWVMPYWPYSQRKWWGALV